MKILRLFLILFVFALGTLAAQPINWEKAQEPYPGIRYVRLSTNKPRPLQISFVRIDLQIPGLHVTSTERDPAWGTPMPNAPDNIIRTHRESTPQYMVRCRTLANRGGRGLNMLVAANASPWTPWPPPKGNAHAQPVGLVISDGVLVSESGNAPPAFFVCYKDGRLAIINDIHPDEYDNVWMALTGFGIILKDGQPVDGGPYENSLMPRMSYGISQDKRYLIIMAIDGRQPGVSEGTKGDETAQFLKSAGAWDGIDMDGGGSATLCLWDAEAQRPFVLSRSESSGYCREVGTNMGFCVAPQPVRP